MCIAKYNYAEKDLDLVDVVGWLFYKYNFIVT